MGSTDIKELLLAPRLDPHRVIELLAPYGLKDFHKADANLQAAAGNPDERLLLAEILEDLMASVASAADPDQALTRFDRFTRAAANKPHLFTYLRNSKQAMEILAKTLGGSSYMAEILIRDPHHFYWVSDPDNLNSSRTKLDIRRDVRPTLEILEDEEKQLDFLRAVKRREMLYIGVRDLLRLASVEQTVASLSFLAEALISSVHEVSAAALKRTWQISPKAFRRFTVLAMGKLGGGELNFSSDVDLMFVYAANGEDESRISAAEYFRRLSQRIAKGLSSFTSEGYVYRVDLRLRPEGSAGNIAETIEGFERYYRTRIGAWERLALLKAWPVGGSRLVGRRFMAMSRPFIYEPQFDSQALDEVREMKARIDDKILERGQTDRNVKLGKGGIREIELVVQTLQAVHAGRIPRILHRSTLPALAMLREHDLIGDEDCESLRDAYIFLRDVENKLQMVEDAQTHSLPQDLEALTACARLLGYSTRPAESPADPFLRDLQRHTSKVNLIFERLVGRRISKG
jgi:glutamate-ammonia-ligase adenylyltransferase